METEPMMIVPDSIEPVTGWRAWYVTPKHRITSQSYGGPGSGCVWEPGQTMEAICTREAVNAVHTDKDGIIPHSECTCGFYAARSREHLLSLDNYHRYDRRRKPTVMGRVHMWGKVRVATLGWRAQYAEPVEILVPYELWEYAPGLKAAYEPHVAVNLDNTLVMPEGDRWCTKCGTKLQPRAHECHTCGTLVEGG